MVPNDGPAIAYHGWPARFRSHGLPVRVPRLPARNYLPLSRWSCSVFYHLSFRHAFHLALVSMLAFVAVGCGSGVGDVTGTVSYKGTRLKGGIVSFVNTSEGPSFTGSINEDGTYTVPKVRSGTYKVCVDTESLKWGGSGASSQKGPPGGPAGVAGPGGPVDISKEVKSGKIKTNTPPEGQGGAPQGYKDAFATMAANAAKYVQIPSKYAKPETTDLTFESKGGLQTYNIELKD